MVKQQQCALSQPRGSHLRKAAILTPNPCPEQGLHPAAPSTDLSHLTAQGERSPCVGRDTRHQQVNPHPSQMHINRLEHLCKNYAIFLEISYSTATPGCAATGRHCEATPRNARGEPQERSRSRLSASPGSAQPPVRVNAMAEGPRVGGFRGAWWFRNTIPV